MKNNFYLSGLVLLITFAFTVVVTPVQAVTSVDENTDVDVTEVENLNKLPEQANVRAYQVQECLQISRVIRQGASGEEVEKLQEFLKEKGHFEFDKITGYYGPVTEEAVKRFQAKEGLVSKGNPETTGYGQIGPKTMARIAKRSCLTENKPDVDDNDEDDEDKDSATVEELEKTIAALQAEIVRLKAKVAKIKAQKEQGDDTDEDGDVDGDNEEDGDVDGDNEEDEGNEE